MKKININKLELIMSLIIFEFRNFINDFIFKKVKLIIV